MSFGAVDDFLQTLFVTVCKNLCSSRILLHHQINSILATVSSLSTVPTAVYCQFYRKERKGYLLYKFYDFLFPNNFITCSTSSSFPEWGGGQGQIVTPYFCLFMFLFLRVVLKLVWQGSYWQNFIALFPVFFMRHSVG